MRISRVIFPFTNEKIGGSHVSSFTLGQCLQNDHGVEVVVAAPHGSMIEKVAREHGFASCPLPEAPSFRHGVLAEASLLPGRLRQLGHQPEGTIVHANDLSALQSWGPAARLRRLPVVYHNRAFNRPVLPNLMVMHLAQRIICISQAVQARLPRSLARRSVLIDNPIDLRARGEALALRQAFEERHPIARGRMLVGFIGNFAHRKRPRFFLEMVQALTARCPSVVAVIFGREVDETQEALERYAADLGIASQVIFAGFQLPVANNILILDMLAATAIDEPLGRTPLEALLLGVPYVATDDAGLGETGRRFGGGLLVPRQAGPDTFAQAVIEGIGAHKAGRFAKAQSAAQSALGVRRHTAQVLALYGELTRKKAVRAAAAQL